MSPEALKCESIFARRPPSSQIRWVFLRTGCVVAHADWPLQPPGLAVLQGLEQRSIPS